MKLSLNRRFIRRRGIAQVVTSGILLAAVSIMGVMMLTWSQTSLFEQKAELEEVFSTRMNKINEELIFENIWFAEPAGIMSENHINVTVANVGILGLNVTSIQITNTTLSNNTSHPYPFSDGGLVYPSSKSFNVTYPWNTADELDVLVITDRGNQFLTQVVSP